LSFTDFDLVRDPRWIGAANYVRIATADPKFAASMRVTFLYVGLAVPLKLTFALAVALLLNKGISGLPLYRAMFYLPSLLGASVAIAVLWRQLFAGDGLVNRVLAPFGIVGPSWISNPDYSPMRWRRSPSGNSARR
jgi:multiple sugar transport system permease protein